MKFIYPVIFACCTTAASPTTHSNTDFSGHIGIDTRTFTDDSDYQNSVYINPSWFWESESNQHQFALTLFGRHDSLDDRRSHADIRELSWHFISDTWELKAGIDKVFWGVTESNHLIDVINQTDLVDSVDGEKKLGQPMLHWSTVQNWGIIDAFLLPYFRERRFAGDEGRLKTTLPILPKQAQ